MSLQTNAGKVAAIYAARAARWSMALGRAMLRALTAVEGKAIDLLSGSGAPFTYPIPVRSGHLRRSMGSKLVSQTTGLIFNTASYALPIHEGKVGRGYGRKGIRNVARRPFAEDALRLAKPGEMIFDDMSKAL